MTKIGSRPPQEPEGTPPAPSGPSSSDWRTQEGVQKFREAAGREKVPPDVVDSFERAAPDLEKQLQALSSPALAGRIRFTSEHLAQLAGAFAAVLQQHPRADRRERARLFAEAILKHKRIGKIFASAREGDLERMFETIAEQLEGSPVFAQLVDEVTEGARTIGRR